MTEHSPGAQVSKAPSRVLSIPNITSFQLYLKYSLLISVLFVMCYGLCNYLTDYRFNRHALYWDWELAIPFVPWMIWGYASMLVLFLFPVFQLDTQRIHRLGMQLIVAILLATGCFLIFPAELGFSRALPEGGYQAVYRFIFMIDYPYNLVPSLHIVFSSLIILALLETATPSWKPIYLAWLVIIGVSVILVHQHHLLDVASGLLLALFSRFIIGRLRFAVLA